MKKIILLIICTCFAIVATHAQGPRDKIKTLKVAYITEKLQLSSDEAEKFWPIYNAHEVKMQQCRSEKFGAIKQKLRGQNIQNIAEADAKQMLDQIEDVEERIFSEKKQLIKDLKKVISAKKILLLKQAEDDFNKQLLNKLREQRKRRFNRN